jgi:NAD(P)-dependent dehydrogenase (short-subunit alcohol dehydrogenase family)
MPTRQGGATKGESVANVRKVCVVTGSSSGIGAATVRLYAKNGWDVVVNYSRDAAPADAVAAECRALGAQTLVVRADIAADADCRRLAVEVEQRFGRADVLVNNAGTTKFVAAKDLDGLDADDFQRIYAVNVIGAYQMVRALVPLIERSGGGAIVNVSSIASMMGTGSSLAYMASKGALNALSVGLARSLAPQIRVNAIAPGLVETPWMEKGLGAERYAATVAGYRGRAALDAVITPEDVAEAAWFLGVAAAKTTGEVLLLDAGLRLRRD